MASMTLTRTQPSMPPRSGTTSRSWPARPPTPGRSSTSTAPPARRSRPPSSTRSTTTTATSTPTSTAASTSSPKPPPRSTRRRATASPPSSTPPPTRECVFVRNTTEAINLVAQTWGRSNIGEGDLIVLSMMEHHSNIVPWQLLAAERGAELAYVPLTDDHRLDMAAFADLLQREPKLVAVTHVSNALGTINDVAAIARQAHAVGADRPGRRGAVRAAPGRSTCRRSTSTSSPSPATRCSARWPPASSTASAPCWRPCRPSWSAAA